MNAKNLNRAFDVFSIVVSAAIVGGLLMLFSSGCNGQNVFVSRASVTSNGRSAFVSTLTTAIKIDQTLISVVRGGHGFQDEIKSSHSHELGDGTYESVFLCGDAIWSFITDGTGRILSAHEFPGAGRSRHYFLTNDNANFWIKKNNNLK